jgi:hypothetical protein
VSLRRGAVLAVLALSLLAAAPATAKAPSYVAVRSGEWIHLAGTEVGCEAYVPANGPGRGRLSWDCSTFGKTLPRPRTYRVLLGAWGLDVQRWNSAVSRSTAVRSFLDRPAGGGGKLLPPGVGANPRRTVTLRAGAAARLGSTDVFCAGIEAKNGIRMLACARYAHGGPGWRCCRGRTYGLYVGANGVVVRRNSADGLSDTAVAEFDNP